MIFKRKNRLNEDVIDCINSIEDPEDCAILGDEDMENALIDSDTEELPDDDYEDTDEDEETVAEADKEEKEAATEPEKEDEDTLKVEEVEE